MKKSKISKAKYHDFYCPFCNQVHLLARRVNRVTCGSKECKRDKKIMYAKKAKELREKNASVKMLNLKTIDVEATGVLDTGREQYNRYSTTTTLENLEGFEAVTFFGSSYRFSTEAKKDDRYRTTYVTDGRFLVLLDGEIRVVASTDSISNATKR